MVSQAEDPLGIETEAMTPFVPVSPKEARPSRFLTFWGASNFLAGGLLAIMAMLTLYTAVRMIVYGPPGIARQLATSIGVWILLWGLGLLLIAGGYGVVIRRTWGRYLLLVGALLVGLVAVISLIVNPIDVIPKFSLLYTGITATLLLVPRYVAEFSAQRVTDRIS